ncbi:MAG: TadE/TadG family type IV pilus assembly protein [Chloroflexota bacterium]
MAAKHLARQRGQSVVELALILPILITLALGTVDLGRLFYYDVQFQSALREAARYAAKNAGVSNSTLQTIVQNEGNLPVGSVTSVTVTNVTGTLGQASIEQVTGTYSFTFVSPWLQTQTSLSNPIRIRTFVAAEVDQG